MYGSQAKGTGGEVDRCLLPEGVEEQPGVAKIQDDTCGLGSGRKKRWMGEAVSTTGAWRDKGEELAHPTHLLPGDEPMSQL